VKPVFVQREPNIQQELGLWNLWLPPDLQHVVKEMGELGTGLTNRECVSIFAQSAYSSTDCCCLFLTRFVRYCLAARMMGAFPWLSEVSVLHWLILAQNV
jgi:hypothetical protein